MARVISLQLVHTVFLLAVVQLINCDCYYPNGHLSTGGDLPCSSESDSACCPLNWKCLSNGLCYLENEKYFGRYTCTDKTWKSESCPNICTHNNTASGDEAVLKCNSGKYCCDANRPDAADAGGGPGCCDTSNDFFPLPDGNLATQSSAAELSSEVTHEQTSTVSTTSSPSLSPSLTTTSIASSGGAPTNNGVVSTPSGAHTSVVLITSVLISSAGSSSSIITLTTAAPQSTSSSIITLTTAAPQSTTNSASTQTPSSKNLGTKIGVGVGVPVGVLALAVVIWFLWRRQKNKKRTASSSMDHAPPTDSNPIDYMYKNNADLGTPYTATTASPEIDQRASEIYSGMGSGPGNGEYRGVSTTGLGMHPTAAELPASPSRLSELSGNSPRQPDLRNWQMSELVGSSSQPPELPEHAFR